MNDERNRSTRTVSDALVFFGATGDLAKKQIFPALQQMIRRGNLDVPVIGVAKSGWTSIGSAPARERASRSMAEASMKRRSLS